MNFCKKMLLTFIVLALVSAGTFDYTFVVAADLPNSANVPYNETSAEFLLDNTTGTVPEVTMGVTVGSEEPPTPTYDLTLEWGNMELTYVFSTDESGVINGGAWSEESFDRTNNKVAITNNTSKEIKGNMTYTNTPESRLEGSENIDDYDVNIKLAMYDEAGSYYKSASVVQQFTLAASGNTGDGATYYIYDEDDLYTKVKDGSMPAPTASISQLKVGIITVQAVFNS